jgi:hypothetical protein
MVQTSNGRMQFEFVTESAICIAFYFFVDRALFDKCVSTWVIDIGIKPTVELVMTGVQEAIPNK